MSLSANGDVEGVLASAPSASAGAPRASAAAAGAGTGAAGLKACSRCLRERDESAYSSAQLKKKGKRVCRMCMEATGGEAITTVSPEGASQQLQRQAEMLRLQQQAQQQLAMEARRMHERAAAVASIDDGLPPPPSSPLPPHPLFPEQQPALWDADRHLACYAYSHEHLQLPLIQRLMEADLSEPYSIFTYRYFLNFWPHLTFLAMRGGACVGCVVCRVTLDKRGLSRGYIAMLAVSAAARGAGLGSTLVKLALRAMRKQGAHLCMLEAECTNRAALALYEKLNFVRETRLVKYYLSGSDAFRLKLWLQPAASANAHAGQTGLQASTSPLHDDED